MRRIAFILTIVLISGHLSLYAKKGAVDYVNSYIGTAQRGAGGTAPFVGSPFAMTSFLPQTRENFIGSMAYLYDDSYIIGFLASHQPTVWMGDYGSVSIMPQTGELRVLPEERKLKFDHKDEEASPYYYSVNMQTAEHGTIRGEMAARSRCALLRFTFPKNKEARLIVQGIDLNPALNNQINDIDNRSGKIRAWIKIDPVKNEIVGYNPDRQSAQLGPELPNFKGYFLIRFDRPIKEFGTWSGKDIFAGKKEQEGTRMGAYLLFKTKNDEEVMAKIATSFISIEQARKNMEEEIPDWNFKRVVVSTKRQWEEKLSRMQVESADENAKSVFYTALYHCYLFPREFSEDGHYYSAFDDKIHEGYSYTDFSLWDTFRAFHPLMTLLEPGLTSRWITALLQMYKEGGWLPKWPNPSYTNIMIGTHADALITDAFMKGIRDYDVNLAYEAVRKDVMVPPDCDTQRRYGDRDPWTSYEAQAGLSYFHSIGYVPEDKTAESLSRTLEYAYDDWCVAQMAKKLGHTEDYRHLMEWSENYKNVYNKKEGFMLPRKYNGDWIVLDDNNGEEITEGSKWTYLFCVLQNIPGLVDLMGKDNFSTKLDRNFEEGFYRHDNEPGHHYIYLYDYCGEPWKTQELVYKHTHVNYKNAPDGVNGNDDCGQMSAWYLFSVTGFYPVTPGSNEFAIGAPQFRKIKIATGKGKTLTVQAENFSDANKYIQAVYLDGKRIGTPFLNYSDLIRATKLIFVMGGNKNEKAFPEMK